MKILSILLFSCWAVLAVNGRANLRMANKGELAGDGEFPYQVSIQIGSQHHCGGSLISKTHVLTAAHCVYDFMIRGGFPAPLFVEVGSKTIGHGTKHKVKRVSYYHKYRGETTQYVVPNDIAMVHLATPVTISDKVAIIELPEPNTPVPADTEVILSGFGTDIIDTPSSRILKKMELKVTPLNECDQYFQRALQRRVTKDKICAARGPGYGACQGDSGGPLVNKAKSIVLGVVSAGDRQCSNGEPDTYTDVSQFRSYIDAELNYSPTSGNQNPAINFDGSNNQAPSPGFPNPGNPNSQFPNVGGSFNFPNPGNPFIPGLEGQFGIPNPFYPQNQQQQQPGFPGPQYPPNPFEQIMPGQGIFGTGQAGPPFGQIWYAGSQKAVPEYTEE